VRCGSGFDQSEIPVCRSLWLVAPIRLTVPACGAKLWTPSSPKQHIPFKSPDPETRLAWPWLAVLFGRLRGGCREVLTSPSGNLLQSAASQKRSYRCAWYAFTDRDPLTSQCVVSGVCCATDDCTLIGRSQNLLAGSESAG